MEMTHKLSAPAREPSVPTECDTRWAVAFTNNGVFKITWRISWFVAEPALLVKFPMLCMSRHANGRIENWKPSRPVASLCALCIQLHLHTSFCPDSTYAFKCQVLFIYFTSSVSAFLRFIVSRCMQWKRNTFAALFRDEEQKQRKRFQKEKGFIHYSYSVCFSFHRCAILGARKREL